MYLSIFLYSGVTRLGLENSEIIEMVGIRCNVCVLHGKIPELLLHLLHLLYGTVFINH